MSIPPQNAHRALDEVLQELPSEVQELARKHKAFLKGRRIKTVWELLRGILLYSGLDKSLREVAGIFTSLDARITDEAVRKRLSGCVEFVQALLRRMLPEMGSICVANEMRFIIIDGSTVKGPGEFGHQYRLHIALTLSNLELVELKLTDKHTGESLRNFQFRKGDVVIADRAYCSREAILEKLEHGVDVILRANHRMLALNSLDGKKLDFYEELKNLEHDNRKSFQVLLSFSSQEEGLKEARGWVHAVRLSPKKAQEARRKCRRYYQKKGKSASDKSLCLSEWVLVFTSLSENIIKPETVLVLYRLRWQIELVIKRWKSLLNVDKLRSMKQSPLSDLWLHGKFLYVLLIEKTTRRRFRFGEMFLDQKRNITFWRPWKMIKEEMNPKITGARFWTAPAMARSLAVMAERSRRRKLQTIPAEALNLHNRHVDSPHEALDDAA